VKLSDGRELSASASATKTVDLPATQWTIAFQPERGAPADSMPLQSFQSWSESADAGVRYFSGTASYRTTIDGRHAAGEHVYLTLSDVREICTVRINGKDAGTIWAMPYRLDITDALAQGKNSIELDMTNLWPNRLIGDEQPGVTHRYTRTNIRKYKADSPLLPSGLIGPVAIEMTRAAPLRATDDKRTVASK